MERHVRLAVALGGALGTLGRLLAGSAEQAWVARVGGRGLLAAELPWSTIGVNLTGAMALGLLARRVRSPLGRAALLTGALGAWTTVSTLAVGVSAQLLAGDPLAGGLDVLITLVGGALAAWLGQRAATPDESLVPAASAGAP